jgi:predicted  nucleic acid-binding Zn-ribbon protein
MSRLKVKCANCGKVFAPANAKQTLCPDCERAQRAARAQKRAEATTPAQSQQPSAPLIQGPGASVLRPGPASVDVSPATPVLELAPADETPAAAQPQQTKTRTTNSAKGSQKARRNGAHVQPKGTSTRVTTPSFTLSSDLRQRIEERYLALANPVEFDGIRTQIAVELGAPKPAVRAVVREVRLRRGMPSWWELQVFAGTPNDLERIKAAYIPHLPLPPVGVHREIAEKLGLEPRMVYRGIRNLRAQMGLPQYNAPEAHDERAEIPVVSDSSASQPIISGASNVDSVE